VALSKKLEGQKPATAAFSYFTSLGVLGLSASCGRFDSVPGPTPSRQYFSWCALDKEAQHPLWSSWNLLLFNDVISSFSGGSPFRLRSTRIQRKRSARGMPDPVVLLISGSYFTGITKIPGLVA